MKQRGLNPLTLWALAFGCCIGWGSFIMPGTTFLPTAGTAGTAIAIFLGALVMILIAANYHFVMQRNSDSGGVFTFTKEIFGCDHAFFCAWFLWIAYVSLLWANATAVTLMGRNLFGGVLQIGFHYTFADYDVYGGEVLVTILFIWIFGIIFARIGLFARFLIKVAAIILFLGVIFLFISAVITSAPPEFYFAEDSSPVKQIFTIVALIPWAFIGFETISQYTNEFKAHANKTFIIMIAAIICAGAIYILMTCLATLKFPPQFGSSEVYLESLKNLGGIERIPTFYVVFSTFNDGISILCIVILSALITSLIGYYRAVGNLTQNLARENILPHWFSTRRHAAIFIFATSIIVPFCGRTVVSWLTDVTTIGATIAYGYTSACTYVLAKRENNKRAEITGILGIICAVLFTFFLLIPNLWSISVLTEESYFILAVWGLFGFAYFNFLFKRDGKKFGTSPTVWLIMFFLVFFSGLMWMREKMYDELRLFVNSINDFYSGNLIAPRLAYTNIQMEKIRAVLLENTLILLTITLIGLGFLFSIYRKIQRKEMILLEEQKRRAEESSRAKSTFLSNMSHDIRTPMNAIIGYTTLAKRSDTTFNDLKSFLEKIDVSGKHLLDLINDILEMSRIESGRMELELAEVDLVKNLRDLQTMFQTQMETKGISFTVEEKIRNKYVMCDKNRWNRILLNLVGNAYKFTPSGKSVSVILSEIGDGNYELRVKDTGIGMSEEFAKKIFQAFERERTSTVSGIQGTGLGTAITKSIVDLMGGTIEVITKKDVGTEFIVRVAFKIAEKPQIAEEPAQGEENLTEDFSAIKILLVEDIEVNREIASMMLQQFGFTIETAENGREAVEKSAGNYDLILMDVQMPIMNGYEATQAIRKAGNAVPIIAMTANAMPEDIKKAREAGMNGHIAKPLEVQNMLETISRVLRGEKL